MFTVASIRGASISEGQISGVAVLAGLQINKPLDGSGVIQDRLGSAGSDLIFRSEC